ncbi:hypothetical protein [Roseibium sp.]|uniref:hypothetical protein n=1 Tax=Roseibium sp. TaxID=1936156 RepID=UPI003B5001C1
MRLSFLFLTVIFILTSDVYADEETAKEPIWYEYIVGILGIPATILAIVYSYIVIKKDSIETRKTKLEIIEKENALSKYTELSETDRKEIITKIVQDNVVIKILLRFVFIYIIFNFWGLVSSAIRSFLKFNSYLIDYLAHLIGNNAAFLIYDNISEAGRLIILLVLGIPLLRDINEYLGIGRPRIHSETDK